MLEPQKYSERLGVIEPDQLREAAERLGLGDVHDAYAPSGGLFGQNLVLETSEGLFVLRGNPYGYAQLTKERRVAGFIHERASLPAPWPYRICDDTDVFGWPFAVMPHLQGTSGTDLWPALDDDGRVNLARATGEALARLHDAAAEFFGPYDAQLDDFIEMEDFGDWTLHRLEHWRERCRAVNALASEAEQWIDDLIEQCAGALDEPFTPVLVHHDFKPENLNFESARDGYVATGVFDLNEAYLGDGEEDLVRMLWLLGTDEERHAFVEAYTSAHPLRDDASDRLAIYALADHLVMWEYRCKVGVVDEDTTFVGIATPRVQRARAIGERATG